MSEEQGNKQGVVSLISNLVLLGTAGWGLKTCYEHPFISAGFGLFAVRGLIGTIAFFDVGGDTFKTVQKHLFKVVDNFGFPLLAMDIMSCKCMRPGFSLLQLLGPAVEFIIFEFNLNEKAEEILPISHAMTAGSAITCAQQKPEYWGSALFPIPFIADILIKKIGEIEEHHDVCLAVGCILAMCVMAEYIP